MSVRTTCGYSFILFSCAHRVGGRLDKSKLVGHENMSVGDDNMFSGYENMFPIYINNNVNNHNIGRLTTV